MATSDLHFCKNCSNMLYLREKTSEHDDKHIYLIEYCRRCGYENESFEMNDSSEDATSASAAASSAAAASAAASATSVSGKITSTKRGIVVYEKSYENN